MFNFQQEQTIKTDYLNNPPSKGASQFGEHTELQGLTPQSTSVAVSP
jgi:hypothetical protein